MPTPISGVVACAINMGSCAASVYLFHQLISPATRDFASWIHLAVGCGTFVATSFVTAPYGKHVSTNAAENKVKEQKKEANTSPKKSFLAFLEKYDIHPKVAWSTQESPTLVAFFWNLFSAWSRGGIAELPTVAHPVACLYVLHYIQRTFVFPFAVMRTNNRVPLSVSLLASFYCSFNGQLQSSPAPLPNTESLSTLGQFGAHFHRRFSHLSAISWFGIGVFAVGMITNIAHDVHLARLRKEQEEKSSPSGLSNKSTYVLPRGLLFSLISCPNMFAELVEWVGYAICAFGIHQQEQNSGSWSTFLAAASFTVYTAANLVPRALSSHRWYLQRFGEEYKKLNRKAVIPFLL